MSKNFKHLMVDIETMGNQSYSAILSIAAVEFNIETGEIGNKFYEKVSLESCLQNGLIVNADTIEFWMQQSKEAKNEIFSNKCVDLSTALHKFSLFCNDKYQIWGNSARFDLGLLQNAYNKLNLKTPWSFRRERCLRTLVSFAPHIKDFIKFEGIRHNALDDCIHQIKYASEIWKLLYLPSVLKKV